jgi:YtcA-like protein
MNTRNRLLATGSACLRAWPSKRRVLQSRDRKGAGTGISMCILTLAACVLTGCGRAPSFDVLGSFFPAWLVCLTLGVALAAAFLWLLSRLHIAIALPVLTYPSLAALFTFALWLELFR